VLVGGVAAMLIGTAWLSRLYSITKENNMQITRNSIETMTGPSEWFTGTVYVDAVAAPSEPSRLGAASVHFTPGARTAWHTHPKGQTIFVTEGVGLCQRRGGPVEMIRPDDAGGRRFGEPCDVGRARHRRGVRRRTRSIGLRTAFKTPP